MDEINAGQQGVQNAENGAAQTAAESGKESGGLMQKLVDFLNQGEKKAAEPAVAKQEPQNTPAGKTYSQADLEAATAAAVAEALAAKDEEARLAKLPEAERIKAEAAKTQKEVERLQAELLRRDLREAATAELAKNALPLDLAELLDYSGKEKMEASLKAVQDSFQASLETALKERLRGKTPPGLNGGGSAEEKLREQIANGIKGGLR